MEYKIEKTLVPRYANRIRIYVQVLLAQKAIIQVQYFECDDDLSPMHTEAIILQGDEYFAWGNDDNYIKELVFKRLNIASLEKPNVELQVEEIIES